MEFVIDRDVMVAMRDGTNLATDVYRPRSDDPVPVLLHRLPYGKYSFYRVGGYLLNPIAAVERGYAVAVQDVRGCWSSEGEFRPIRQERDDGHDTIEWAAGQEWCNGSVGLYGSSYMGMTTLQATVDAPPALKASLAYLTAGSYHDTWCYTGGAFELASMFRWALSDAARRRGRQADETNPALALAMAAMTADPLGRFASTMDPRALVAGFSNLIPYFEEWLDHPVYDEYWASIDVSNAVDRISTPVLNIAGWYDGFLKSGIDLHAALSTEGGISARSNHALIVGPWDHRAYTGVLTTSSAGSHSYGASAAGGQEGLEATCLDWFDRWLRDGGTEFSPVKYFHIGPNQWSESRTWPPESVELHRWHLSSSGDARSRAGDGRLQRNQAVGASVDSYIYDPQHPVPTISGRHLAYFVPSGVQDQRLVEDRADVLVYDSQLLLEPYALLGPVALDLYVRTSAPTTDFCATLVDVHSDGRAENVAEGICRLPIEKDAVARVDSVRRIEVDLGDTAYTFPTGHRVRLHITSSNFPRFDRNRNLDPRASEPTEWQPATQHVMHDEEHPSALVLTTAKVGSSP